MPTVRFIAAARPLRPASRGGGTRAPVVLPVSVEGWRCRCAKEREPGRMHRRARGLFSGNGTSVSIARRGCWGSLSAHITLRFCRPCIEAHRPLHRGGAPSPTSVVRWGNASPCRASRVGRGLAVPLREGTRAGLHAPSGAGSVLSATERRWVSHAGASWGDRRKKRKPIMSRRLGVSGLGVSVFRPCSLRTCGFWYPRCSQQWSLSLLVFLRTCLRLVSPSFAAVSPLQIDSLAQLPSPPPLQNSLLPPPLHTYPPLPIA
jgi:hypothetical protein